MTVFTFSPIDTKHGVNSYARYVGPMMPDMASKNDLKMRFMKYVFYPCSHESFTSVYGYQSTPHAAPLGASSGDLNNNLMSNTASKLRYTWV